MIVIDTRISPPDARWMAVRNAQGDRVVHLPALECVPTGIPVDLKDCDAAWVGSPRAAALCLEALRQFPGEIWTAGASTAEELRQGGVTVSRCGNAEGVASFLASLAIAGSGIFPVRSVGWLSAEETAESHEDLSRTYGFTVKFFPVYRTLARIPDPVFLKTLPAPRLWLFYSGRAVVSLKPYIAPEDRVELHGRSAARAGADLLNAVILGIES